MMKFSSRKAIRPALIAVAALAATPVLAQEGIVRGILGIGGAIVINEMYRNQKPTAAPRAAPVDPAIAQRAAQERERMRLIQTRLNALGYDAGAPDGVVGPRTRRAIADFQVSIGEDPTGSLDEAQLAALYERSSGFGDSGPANAAFPSLGAPGMAATPASAFPSLGAPVAAPSQPASAFPALGGPAASPAAAPAGAFPALGVPGATPPVPAFPTIAGAPVAVTTPAPLLAGEGAAPVVLPPADNLAVEVGKTEYAALDAQPAVLGVSLGSSDAAFKAMLETNGFAGCVAGATAQQCVRETASLTDTVKGWLAGEEGLWAMARLIQFKEPVAADFVRGQFSETYPELMAAADGVVSSGQACSIGTQSVPALAALFDGRADPAGATDVPPALLQLAASCPVAYAVAFNEGNNLVAAVQVLLFDGTSIVRQHQRATSQRQTQLDADLKF